MCLKRTLTVNVVIFLMLLLDLEILDRIAGGIKVQLKERIYSNKEYIRERTPLFGSFIAD